MKDIFNKSVSKNLIAYLEPFSIATEAYRSACTNILYSSIDKKINSIVITSPYISEGKSVTASNIAICFSNLNKKVLLVDADLRNPSIYKQFNIENKLGLTNILTEELTIEESVNVFDPNKNLHILNAGTRIYNPYELISSNKIKQFINDTKNKYDIIIIDTPPVCCVSDALVMSTYVDGVILTIALKESNVKLTKKAIRMFQNIDTKMLGCIVTKVQNSKKYYNVY